MRYSAFLESYLDGRSMAHVLDLPGCTAIGSTAVEALAQLEDAARGYHLWLTSHDDPSALPEEPVEMVVAERVEGAAPLTPGDAATLFVPDRQPLDDVTLARYLRLMAYSRADLTTLIDTLPDDNFDRVAGAESFSIRRLLTHIANAEEWYISRLGSEDHPYHVAMGRRFDEADIRVRLVAVREMAVRRLCVLSSDERAVVFTRPEYTDHPDEEWTARKVLRRFVEHEREHTAQLMAMLEEWKPR